VDAIGEALGGKGLGAAADLGEALELNADAKVAILATA
jgi:hypothetical protein